MIAEADRIALINKALDEAARVKAAMRTLAPDISRVAAALADGFRHGHHLYACGNGGSACDAMHLVEELVARYKRDRPGLPAHHMLDAATLTCWSNDYEFNGVFERQVQAMVGQGDFLVAISTSGNSANVVRAVEAATLKGAVTIGLTGGDGGVLSGMCTHTLSVPAVATERIQEGHIVIIHLLCELIEDILFATPPSNEE
ncbi:MAG TPA: SIS domain-containing protein [Longimicrobiaceae bacterium]|nr:SIS domain-containing protein [Longimicrobiaceae bacterium]